MSACACGPVCTASVPGQPRCGLVARHSSASACAEDRAVVAGPQASALIVEGAFLFFANAQTMHQLLAGPRDLALVQALSVPGSKLQSQARGATPPWSRCLLRWLRRRRCRSCHHCFRSSDVVVHQAVQPAASADAARPSRRIQLIHWRFQRWPASCQPAGLMPWYVSGRACSMAGAAG